MEVPIPFVDASIDFSEPSSAAVTGGALVGGFSLFYLASHGGRKISNNLIEAAGMGSDDGVEVL